MNPWKLASLVVCIVCAWARSLAAQPEPTSYALVVGANRGGHGQAELRYATDDARQFAAVVRELGRIAPERQELLLEPSVDALVNALTRLREKLTVDARAGRRAKVFFYYSGHAKARALSFGGGELSLAALRSALLALPSTLTVAVLDACQSGAISGVKGATPAADFSTSTVSDLDFSGVAVMASSTESEFSQESSELGASYFTHHLLSALRGAADGDHDGQVSLQEAYDHAYRYTLSDTLRTRVGSQHATLEMALKGHGHVPLTFTSDADAQLWLTSAIRGRVVVQQARHGAVLAELDKANDASLTIALPHGAYEILVRSEQGDAPLSCKVELEPGARYPLNTRACRKVDVVQALAAKGGVSARERPFFELGASRHLVHGDDYTSTLRTFGFRNAGSYVLADDSGSFGPLLAGGLGLGPHLSVLARLDRLQKRSFLSVVEQADDPDVITRFRWQTWALALGARARFPLWDERVVPYGELDLGLGIARTVFARSGGDVRETHAGPVVRADLGAIVSVYAGFGAVLAVGYDFAPVVKNELDQRRDDGGFHASLCLRFQLPRKDV